MVQAVQFMATQSLEIIAAANSYSSQTSHKDVTGEGDVLPKDLRSKSAKGWRQEEEEAEEAEEVGQFIGHLLACGL